MVRTVVSAKGRTIDMQALKRANPNTVTIGNTHTNARGDVLDIKTGKVAKPRQAVRQTKLHTNVPKNAPVSKPVAPKKGK